MNKVYLLSISILLSAPSFAQADFWKDIKNDLLDNVRESITGRPADRNQNVQQAESGDYVPPQPRGTIIIQCGCNGNVSIGATRQSNVCASGVEQAIQCRGRCTGGGFPWASVCQ